MKRVQKIEDLKDRVEELQTTVRITLDGGNDNTTINGTNTMGNTGYGYQNDLENKPLVRGDDGEYEDTRGKDNR